MPMRVTTDANGCVILVESTPEREPPPKPQRGKISVDKTKKFEWNEDKTSKSSRKQFGTRSMSGSLISWVSCPLCKSLISKRKLKKHLRKKHPAQDSRKPTDGTQSAIKPSNKNQPKRSEVVNERSEYARRLLRELREETKVKNENEVQSASSGGTAPKGIEQPSGKSIHIVDDKIGKTVPTSKNRTTPKRETKKQANNAIQGSAAKQKKADKLRAEIRAIGKELKKLAPGFHRIEIVRLQMRQDLLREQVEKLERPLTKKAVAQGRFPGRAGRLGARTEQHKEDSLRERAENEYGGKYLGHMRRDYDGSFGSISLYDDYGEESFPD